MTAFFCEAATTEPDQAVSIQRIFNQYRILLAIPHSPPKMPAISIEPVLFVRVVAGGRPGRRQLAIVARNPIGDETVVDQKPVDLPAESHKWLDVITTLRMRLSIPGVYWFSVRVDDREVTRVPLEIVYDPSGT